MVPAALAEVLDRNRVRTSFAVRNGPFPGESTRPASRMSRRFSAAARSSRCRYRASYSMNNGWSSMMVHLPSVLVLSSKRCAPRTTKDIVQDSLSSKKAYFAKEFSEDSQATVSCRPSCATGSDCNVSSRLDILTGLGIAGLGRVIPVSSEGTKWSVTGVLMGWGSRDGAFP